MEISPLIVLLLSFLMFDHYIKQSKKQRRFKVALVDENARAPVRANTDDAGYDLVSLKSLVMQPGTTIHVDVGIALELPSDCYARVASRSSLATKHNVIVLGGVVDSGYRGRLNVVLRNTGLKVYHISAGDRVAQLVLEKIYTPVFEVVPYDKLTKTIRGANGFGSTGL